MILMRNWLLFYKLGKNIINLIDTGFIIGVTIVIDGTDQNRAHSRQSKHLFKMERIDFFQASILWKNQEGKAFCKSILSEKLIQNRMVLFKRYNRTLYFYNLAILIYILCRPVSHFVVALEDSIALEQLKNKYACLMYHNIIKMDFVIVIIKGTILKNYFVSGKTVQDTENFSTVYFFGTMNKFFPARRTKLGRVRIEIVT